MALENGQSEIDTVTLKLLDFDKEITAWESYSIKSDFLTPSAGFNFTFASSDPTFKDLLVTGAKVQILINNLPQMTGYIEKREISASRKSGFVYSISGRDILGSVVSASLDPATKISADQTILDFIYSILSFFGINNIYIGDEINFNICTGFLKGQGQSQTTKEVTKTLQRREPDPDHPGFQRLVSSEDTKTKTIQLNRPDLKDFKSDQLKTKTGDGAMQMIQKILTRYGLAMWALVDGTGVVIDRPYFDEKTPFNIFRREDENDVVLDASVTENDEYQPSCVVGFGKGGGGDSAKVGLVCMAVNELVCVHPDGTVTDEVLDLIARYPKMYLLPFKVQLIPKTEKKVYFQQKPLFFEDDESKTTEQLAAVVRKKLAHHQKESQVLNYTVKGHTHDTYPWQPNVLCGVEDFKFGITDYYWILSREFKKSRKEGTMTNLTLIRPYTLELGES